MTMSFVSPACEQSGAGSLDDPGSDENRRGPRQRATRGGSRKQAKADQERPAATRHVGHPAAEDQQSAEHQCVRREHPLQSGVGET